MTADREALREAIRGAIDEDYRKRMNPDDIADAIVDAVLAAEHFTYEWAYRYPNGHVATWIPQLMTEDIARDMVAEYPDLLTVVRRRVTDWEKAPDGET